MTQHMTLDGAADDLVDFNGKLICGYVEHSWNSW